ncbi:MULTISPECIES: hypothetical protein [unclassified Actinoplanes]|uniref:hypothetical protein n=1 Tax=unclassified Actinoplanes TaxID=2626549 RepID=UPI0002D7A35F|nr:MULTISPECIES: hypothetical protein [unclassified Actinoplanes]
MGAEVEPFQALQASLSQYFDGDFDAALAEDESAALADADRIIAEHVRTAQVRLARAAPALDWSDHTTLTEALPAIARRAADLRFVQILGTPAPTVTITVDHQPAETIPRAAARHDLDVNTLTSAVRRANLSPATRLDARTPLYRTDGIDRLLRSRRPRQNPAP